MTEEEATALGKRLVACKGFRPMRGMLDMQGRTWDASLLWRWSSAVDVPDLRDPATLGCVLALVREAYGERRTGVKWWEPEGCVYVEHPLEGWKRPDELFPTEAHALVAALEAAP